MVEKIKEELTTDAAAEYCLEHFNRKVSKQTIRDWCRNYGIGIKVVGRWMVDKTDLHSLLDND